MEAVHLGHCHRLGWAFGAVWPERWLVHGSYEWVPTAEQQDKARIAAVYWLILTVPVLAWCIFMRLQRKK